MILNNNELSLQFIQKIKRFFRQLVNGFLYFPSSFVALFNVIRNCSQLNAGYVHHTASIKKGSSLHTFYFGFKNTRNTTNGLFITVNRINGNSVHFPPTLIHKHALRHLCGNLFFFKREGICLLQLQFC